MSRLRGRGVVARPEAKPDVFGGLSLRVAEPLCLVGDLHGCRHLLERLLERRERDFPSHRLVVLGDMIDRGPDSAGVLHLLRDCSSALCLAGNHEAMLLAALEEPETAAAPWLAAGGLQTLASFGVSGLSAPPREIMAALRFQMGAALETWLRQLPLLWQSGNLVMAHAGLDPSLPPERQSRNTLLWGHPDLPHLPRRDGLYLAHGHYVTETAAFTQGRLSLDTGAYATGVLSYALVEPQTGPGEAVRLETLI